MIEARETLAKTFCSFKGTPSSLVFITSPKANLKGQTRGSICHKLLSCHAVSSQENFVTRQKGDCDGGKTCVSCANFSSTLPRCSGQSGHAKGQVSKEPIRYVSTDAKCALERNLQTSVWSGWAVLKSNSETAKENLKTAKQIYLNKCSCFDQSWYSEIITGPITHLIPKWRPINYSFVCMLISPLRFIFTSKFFCFL